MVTQFQIVWGCRFSCAPDSLVCSCKLNPPQARPKQAAVVIEQFAKQIAVLIDDEPRTAIYPAFPCHFMEA